MSAEARFWAVDFHVHTPASADVNVEAFGTAENIVAAAIAAKLDAIAVTDHNTGDWCDAVGAAAQGKPLVVLPGVEISTTEGHLLAIWEEGTHGSVINEMLVKVGIGQAERGKLDVSADVGFAQAAQEVAACGGLAIAAHVDKPKGLLGLQVAAHLRKTLLDESLAGVEIFALETAEIVASKVQNRRILGCVRGSDTWDAAASAHALSGIGVRRTWVKASRPDLIGIRHALGDPDLRISLNPPPEARYPQLHRVEIAGGFLNGQVLDLCPDLNCLLGGTGAGKSLVIEAVRYAMNQQLDKETFPTLWDEIHSRLDSALTSTGVVRVEFSAGSDYYRVERPFSRDGSAGPLVKQLVGGDWITVGLDPAELLTLAAFSQGEVLAYSRQPVGRISLVDSAIDLSKPNAVISRISDDLRDNGRELLKARQREQTLIQQLSKSAETSERVRELEALFDTSVVKEQAMWQKERSQLTRVRTTVDELEAPIPSLPKPPARPEIGNIDLIDSARDILTSLKKTLDASTIEVNKAIDTARAALQTVGADWNGRFVDFQRRLDAEMEKFESGTSLKVLRRRLESMQEQLEELRALKDELENEARPAVVRLRTERENLLEDLQAARRLRREMRRERVKTLNRKTAGFVKLDIPTRGDSGSFRAALNGLKVGSRVREQVIDSIARAIHPIKFARALWDGKISDIVNEDEGIDTQSVARLLTNIDEKELWLDLLNVQTVDLPDVLSVKFRKPDDGAYTPIEELAHGQRCTAILVILLADGETPVLVDQPEDALHAPWIEDYLVDRLRQLRGTRQYVFATRSPGIVVSGDAEQIITMKATAGHGEIEAIGSLERHELNKLTLHHLEGGPSPFARRARKFHVSTGLED